jgi:hypothetical protein
MAREHDRGALQAGEAGVWAQQGPGTRSSSLASVWPTLRLAGYSYRHIAISGSGRARATCRVRAGARRRAGPYGRWPR